MYRWNFTGREESEFYFYRLVEEMGEVLAIENGEKSLKIKIKCKKVLDKSQVGDSIATNGTCLTAVEIGENYLLLTACMKQ